MVVTQCLWHRYLQVLSRLAFEYRRAQDRPSEWQDRPNAFSLSAARIYVKAALGDRAFEEVFYQL